MKAREERIIKEAELIPLPPGGVSQAHNCPPSNPHASVDRPRDSHRGHLCGVSTQAYAAQAPQRMTRPTNACTAGHDRFLLTMIKCDHGPPPLIYILPLILKNVGAIHHRVLPWHSHSVCTHFTFDTRSKSALTSGALHNLSRTEGRPGLFAWLRFCSPRNTCSIDVPLRPGWMLLLQQDFCSSATATISVNNAGKLNPTHCVTANFAFLPEMLT